MGDSNKVVAMVVEVGEEEKERLIDFDMLCSRVAMNTNNGKWNTLHESYENDDEESGELGGGVFRMWEGDMLDSFDDRRLFLQSSFLDGVAWIKGKFHSYINFKEVRANLVLSLSTKGRLLGIIFELIRQNTNETRRTNMRLIQHYGNLQDQVRLGLVVVMYRRDDDEKPCINNNDSIFEYSAFVINSS
nr:PLAC8 family protein [Tanacetum cinerariifolium]